MHRIRHTNRMTLPLITFPAFPFAIRNRVLPIALPTVITPAMPVHIVIHQRVPPITLLNRLPSRLPLHDLIHLGPQPRHLSPSPRQLLPRPSTHDPTPPNLILELTHLTLRPHRNSRQILSPNRLHQTHRTRQTPRNIRSRQPRQRQPRHQPRTIRPRQRRRTPPRPRRRQHRRHQQLIRNPPGHRPINTLSVAHTTHSYHPNPTKPMDQPTRRDPQPGPATTPPTRGAPLNDIDIPAPCTNTS
jgi:hypothetical protein